MGKKLESENIDEMKDVILKYLDLNQKKQQDQLDPIEELEYDEIIDNLKKFSEDS
ncbi:MAG: hypothetical protein V3575_02690 [Candidatus Absconditabacteria bacterium]